MNDNINKAKVKKLTKAHVDRKRQRVVEEPKRMERKRTRRELKRKKQLKNNGVI
jgi:hypothetical protein